MRAYAEIYTCLHQRLVVGEKSQFHNQPSSANREPTLHGKPVKNIIAPAQRRTDPLNATLPNRVRLDSEEELRPFPKMMFSADCEKPRCN